MKKLITLYLLLFPVLAGAQELVTTAGGEGNGVFWSVGEILTLPVTDAGTTYSVTPGFLQPDYIRYTAIDNPANEQASLFVYPNPVKDKLHIRGKAESVTWKLFDSTGRTWGAGTFSGTEQTVDFNAYPAGYYLLQVTSPEGTQLFKLVK
jgi:hypothetical protein